MNLDVIFYSGLEIKPCESRLEFVHPKNKKAEKKTTKEDEKSTLPAKSFFLTVFLGLWV